MKALTILGVVLVLVGLAVVAGVYAPRALGQSVAVRVDPRPAIEQVLVGGGSQVGISIRDVEKADVEREKLTGQAGAAIEEVRSGSPAEKAGLKAGDVVIEYDGERVRGAAQLSRLVRETPEGRTVKAAVMRAGARVEVSLTPASGGAFYFGDQWGRDLERLKGDLALKIQPELDRLRDLRVEPFTFDFGGRVQAGRLGINAQDLTPQLAEYFGVKDGVLVSAVTGGSVAANAGVKAGDVITAIDNVPIASVTDVRRRVDRIDENQAFTIAITRDRKALTLNGKMTRDEARVRERRRIVSVL
jgi:serine protease Do